MMEFIFNLFNASQIGGWVRAFAASAVTYLAAKYDFINMLSGYEGFQEAFAVVVAGVAVGVWSSLAKKYAK